MALIRCPKCNSLFSETKKACLRCGEPVKQTSEKLNDKNKLRDKDDKQVDGGFKLFGKGTQITLESKLNESFSVIAFSVLILIVILIRACSGGSNETKPAELSLPDNPNPHFIAKKTIELMLRNPKDAEFPSITDIQITDLGNGNWTVLGYVDAKNAFNATQRVKYKVEMHAKDQCNDYNSFTCWDNIKPYM